MKKNDVYKLIIAGCIGMLFTILIYQFIIPPRIVYKQIDEYEAEISRLEDRNTSLVYLLDRREKLADSLLGLIPAAQNKIDETNKEMEELLKNYENIKRNLINRPNDDHLRIFSGYTDGDTIWRYNGTGPHGADTGGQQHLP